MSQIMTVETEIKNFKPLERAYEALGYKKSKGDQNDFTISKGRLSLQVTKKGEFYTVVGDSDDMGYSYGNRGNSSSIIELQNEYNKEEALAWAKYEGRTVISVKGSASKGYEIEISG